MSTQFCRVPLTRGDKAQLLCGSRTPSPGWGAAVGPLGALPCGCPPPGGILLSSFSPPACSPAGCGIRAFHLPQGLWGRAQLRATCTAATFCSVMGSSVELPLRGCTQQQHGGGGGGSAHGPPQGLGLGSLPLYQCPSWGPGGTGGHLWLASVRIKSLALFAARCSPRALCNSIE